ncbi:cysteine--tRNA ligase [Natronobacterium gregoryi]|uniref:Cysteine--tRNA ligase n=2 Tax=Natronobacterium gregoryi TaxID=44930 RepID=L0AM91_NATGS|nr:cysteine--tRNA ligase [Natronobacterium gregoryi]AFZ74911.1 cysteinyl-tRNA synthetase [Natronobacterium gregoryi SP2]ELY67388.1 cysteinyl-tRNA synthetase [Natronobacterium gregoryi SP2]PLK19839.1 cysteine--tRNA ligase [Natronobacterium gregoryi SP2]SFJ38974.1 cysteinyl-tRNA synthetase [Natronobacterium gregoryi]
MTLHVTNTLTGEKEPFEPQDPENVLLYYCGLTVSDPPHLGHARSWVHVDVMHRWLEYLGYDVRHVENFTDVNEKIVARVGEDDLGEDESEVATTYVERTLADMRSLNLLRAEVYPRVSEHVPEIVDLVETLIEKGYAYESNGSVYFDVTQFDDYGKLSNQELEEIESQGDPEERTEKCHPADFALWKAGSVDPDAIEDHRHEDAADPEHACETALTWDSPWGEGRPGWHVECSAMSMTHLDETLDIHVGGRDLVFPHHENEIAQSEAATDKQFANYWLHCELFQLDDEKMSSSLGNFVTVDEGVDQWGTNVLRTFLTAGSYNSKQLYSDETIAEAKERWEQLERAHEAAVAAIDSPDAATKVDDETLRAAVDEAREEFTTAMNDDFNTRKAQSALLSIATAINRHLEDRDRYDYRGLREAVETLEELGDVLGLSVTGDTTGSADLAGDVVDLVLDVREQEREAGNYERADELRDELEALGIEVQDTDGGPTYRLPSE